MDEIIPSDNLSLLDKWRYINKDIKSPNSYIDMTFFFLIGAALQRRVWVSASHMPIFANPYIILVGEPGVGKGLVIKQAKELLSFHKFQIQQKPAGPTKDGNADIVSMEQVVARLEQIEEEKKIASGKADSFKKKRNDSEIPLFPSGADATSYEALVEAMEKAHRYIFYDAVNPDGTTVKKRYGHHSMCFALEEISSLFRKRANDIVNFLITTYDAGDYKYETKHYGTNIIQKCCLAFYGGTTPQFMQETFDDRLIGEGFASRCLFIYASENRFNRFGIAELNDTQRKYKAEILERLKFLSTLYGQVIYTGEAFEHFRHYFEQIHPFSRPNSSRLLIPYYARKDQHAMKLSLMMHFADNDGMTIGVDTCRSVLNLLEALEGNMHSAINFGGKNHLSKVGRQVLKYIAQRMEPVLFVDIFKEFVGDVKEAELREVFDFLLQTGAIEKGEFMIPGTQTRKVSYIVSPKQTKSLKA